MRKFIFKTLLFFCFWVIMDVLFGYGFSWLRSHAKGGSTANCEYIANRSIDDIIILGSSRATHHYVSQIIEDSLGLSCYNCGEEGNGVVLAYGRLKMLTDRYKPKLILYEVTPCFDYGTLEPNTSYLGYLRAYYWKDGIKEIFNDFGDELSRVKMLSQMYQNTSRLLPDIVDNLIYRDNRKGYAPLYGKMNLTVKDIKEPSEENPIYDSLKLRYLLKVIKLAQTNDIPILFMISPRYGENATIDDFKPALELCDSHGVRVCNYINEPDIASRSDFFQDVGHMNDAGAVAYTNKLIGELKKEIVIK